MPRLSVAALDDLLGEGEGDGVTLIDVRGPGAQGPAIPGAIPVSFDTLADLLGLGAGQRIVVYCACPNEISAVLMCERILAVHRDAQTFALAGGYDAWQNRPADALGGQMADPQHDHGPAGQQE